MMNSTHAHKRMQCSALHRRFRLFGVINSVLLVPVCISFATIIYRDPFFNDHLPMLIKMVLCSAMCHQVVFTTFSSLPFAIGQVQDAGLIFLSAMSTSVVHLCVKKGVSDQAIISTVQHERALLVICPL